MKRFKNLMLVIILSLLAPILMPLTAKALEAPAVSAPYFILVNLDTDKTIWECNSEQSVPVASLVKLMTGLLAVEAIDEGRMNLDDQVQAQMDAWTGLTTSCTNAAIQGNEVLSLRDVLYCVLMGSCEEACNVLATHMAGSIDNFVAMMNARAADLGCTGTHFSDPNGYSDIDNYSTAYDLSLIAREALKHPLFLDICSTTSYTRHADYFGYTYDKQIFNPNALLGSTAQFGDQYYYQYARGLQVGYTLNAGYCLASTITRDDNNILAIVLGCSGPTSGYSLDPTTGLYVYNYNPDYTNYSDSITLYEWLFNNYSYIRILNKKDVMTTIHVKHANGRGNLSLKPADSMHAFLPNDADLIRLKYVYDLDEDVVAPVKEGTVLGTVTVSYDGVEYGTMDLIAADDMSISGKITAYNNLLAYLDEHRGFLMTIILVAFVMIIAIIIAVRYYLDKRKKAGITGLNINIDLSGVSSAVKKLGSNLNNKLDHTVTSIKEKTSKKKSDPTENGVQNFEDEE